MMEVNSTVENRDPRATSRDVCAPDGVPEGLRIDGRNGLIERRLEGSILVDSVHARERSDPLDILVTGLREIQGKPIESDLIGALNRGTRHQGLNGLSQFGLRVSDLPQMDAALLI